MRIALCTHSTNPRGGVVHAIELGEALAEMGHQVVVHAPDPGGKGFYRQLRCGQGLIPALPTEGGIGEMVRQRIDEYAAYFEQRTDPFDIYHAQDGISANALARLVARGRLRGFVRTVHHLDDFTDPYLSECQDLSVTAASACFCVSQTWQERIRATCRIDAELVPNGVNIRRFGSIHDASDPMLKKRLGIGTGPVFLSVGGVEERKNSVRILQAFEVIRKEHPGAQLLIAGGASLLDHGDYRRQFEEQLRAAGLVGSSSVVFVNVVPDEQMPALFRAADALVFPSLREGFGLVVLEAMACGTPVIVSDEAPFTEYLTSRESIMVNPRDVNAIAGAMRRAIGSEERIRLTHAAHSLCEAMSWERSAAVHVDLYQGLLEREGARHAGNAVSSSLA